MRRLLLALALITVPFLVRADALPSYTLTLTSDEVLYCAKLLRKAPYEEVSALLSKMQSQMDAQSSAAAVKAEADAKARIDAAIAEGIKAKPAEGATP